MKQVLQQNVWHMLTPHAEWEASLPSRLRHGWTSKVWALTQFSYYEVGAQGIGARGHGCLSLEECEAYLSV